MPYNLFSGGCIKVCNFWWNIAIGERILTVNSRFELFCSRLSQNRTTDWTTAERLHRPSRRGFWASTTEKWTAKWTSGEQQANNKRTLIENIRRIKRIKRKERLNRASEIFSVGQLVFRGDDGFLPPSNISPLTPSHTKYHSNPHFFAARSDKKGPSCDSPDVCLFDYDFLVIRRFWRVLRSSVSWAVIASSVRFMTFST